MLKKFLTALPTGEALFEGDSIKVSGHETTFIARDTSIDENGFVCIVYDRGSAPVENVSRSAWRKFKDMEHVDAFIDYGFGVNEYARFVLLLKRLPAALRLDFRVLTEPFKLWCKYQDAWYAVTGASRLGDIWLNTDLDKTSGYTARVSVLHCSCWTGTRPE